MSLCSGQAILESRSLLYHGLRSSSQEYVDVPMENMFYQSSVWHTKDKQPRQCLWQILPLSSYSLTFLWAFKYTSWIKKASLIQNQAGQETFCLPESSNCVEGKKVCCVAGVSHWPFQRLTGNAQNGYFLYIRRKHESVIRKRPCCMVFAYCYYSTQ